MKQEVIVTTPEEAIETIRANMPTSGYQMLRESLNMAVQALEEIQEYRAIGTAGECRAAMEKQKRRKPQKKNLFLVGNVAECACGYILNTSAKFCPYCGQAIDWRDGK